MKKTMMLLILSLGMFGIAQAQRLTLLLPNGGETLVNGTPMLITWNYSKLTGDETLLIALEGTIDFGPIAYSKVSAGSLEWLAGRKMDGTFAKPGGGYKIIIELVDGDTAYDLSDAPFTLAAPATVVTLMTPNGGEALEMGRDFDVNWSCAGKEGFVTLSLYRDEQPLGLIAENLPAAGLRYRWRIGAPLLNGMTYAAGANYRIQILWRPRPVVNPGKGDGEMEGRAKLAGVAMNNSDRSDNAFQILVSATRSPQKDPKDKEN